MPAQRRQLWPFAALSASYFAHIGFFNPYLPLWLKELGYSLVVISALTALQSGTRLFAPYLWGWLSDHTGHRVWLMRFCATVALLASLALAMPWGVAGVVVVLLVMFTHTSAMMPMSEAALAQIVSHGEGGFDAKRYGRIRLWGSLGFLVTVMLAGAWFERYGMGSFPYWTAGTLLLVTLSVWWMADQREASHHHSSPSVPLGPVLRQPVVRWFLVSVFFHILAHIFVYIFFSLYLDSLGYSKTVIGLLWAASVVVEIGWFFTQGHWLPMLTLQRWLWLAAVLMALRMAVTAGWGSWWWVLVLAQALHAITFAAHHSVCIALLTQYFPGRLRGRGQAMYAVVGYGLSGVLGGVVGGWISARWGLQMVFWLGVVAAILAAFAAWRMSVASAVSNV